MILLDPRPGVRDHVRTDEPARAPEAPPPDESRTFDDLAADCAEVTQALTRVRPQRILSIPERAVSMVAGLGTYGD